ncbi:hypothetical protein C1H46_021919 [Malus baccata]|uniref:BURP domain-containing protein n=1 Tax=Malus baccata TaxID=106549 RepID=A0A540M179_MALBA|nr:hypothetical protein C1H46_021919 [Malus baccata]
MNDKASSFQCAETSKWNPKHAVFRFLKVQPRTIAICHFLFEDTIGLVQEIRSLLSLNPSVLPGHLA